MRRCLIPLILGLMLCGVCVIDRVAEASVELEDVVSIEIEDLAAKYNVEIKKSKDGDVEITKILINSVMFSRFKQGGKSSLVSQDVSGRGAVMCAWGIYSMLRAGMDFCLADEHQEAKDALSRALSDMNVFIMANSVLPVTLDQLERRTAEIRAKTIADAKKLKPEEILRACRSGDFSGFYKQFLDQPPEEYQRAIAKMRTEVADLLSVPRPPVTNPCL